MGIYIRIEAKNEKKSRNREFKLRKLDDFKDGKFRGYSQEAFYGNEYDIIEDIKNGSDYRVDVRTKCKVSKRGTEEYLTTMGDDTEDNNIVNLPTYKRNLEI